MNGTALVIGVAYAITVVVGSVIALALARSATRRSEIDHGELARRENAWLVVVLVLLVSLLLATIWLTPYGDAGQAASGGRRVIEVTGVQFAWTVAPNEVQAGEQIEFRIRAADVNHAFGLYDPDDRLVFQVQAIPDSLQKEYATLTKPGVYRIVCLEYCGVAHHAMLSRLVVRP
jgi:cytochrome c oxidase subunit II